MDVKAAWDATLARMLEHDRINAMQGHRQLWGQGPCSEVHLQEMDQRMVEFAFAHAHPLKGLDDLTRLLTKMHRWLGWLQGIAVARGLLTLDECKEINRLA